MAPRASWKGFLKVSELVFPAALYAGATTSGRISFHVLNRKTGHRVKRQYIDEETEKPVEPEDQAKGYETQDGEYVVVEPEEIAETVPESDKTIRIEAFVRCDDVDTVYFDRPYYLAPSGVVSADSFGVIREGMRRKKVAALGRVVLFRRLRTILMRPEGPGLVANTLNFDYEVRQAEEVFADLPEKKIEGEMLDLAKYIIETKSGTFDPRSFDDRYDQALAELIKAKLEGREIKRPPPPKEKKVVSLMDALRRSAEAGAGPARKRKADAGRRAKGAAKERRKAG